MNHEVFGELKFDSGFSSYTYITLFGHKFEIELLLSAYFEKDGISKEQEQAYLQFINKRVEYSKCVEKSLTSFDEMTYKTRFMPQTLFIKRDGCFSVLFDDSEAPDDGIAVILFPEVDVLSQDEFL